MIRIKFLKDECVAAHIPFNGFSQHDLDGYRMYMQEKRVYFQGFNLYKRNLLGYLKDKLIPPKSRWYDPDKLDFSGDKRSIQYNHNN